MYIRIANLKKAKPRKSPDMHSRIANLRKLMLGNIGYVQTDYQS